mmetsp:Transcript_97705/g.173149  ORF Transcript_97705/g.173149 Transcript_97705/m.173149 type:complete len:316 (-) Transcript_97705:83-1030(-)
MSVFLTRVVFSFGIAWASTVIRREVGRRGEMQSSLDVEDDRPEHKTVHLGAGGQMILENTKRVQTLEVHLEAENGGSDLSLQEGAHVSKKNVVDDSKKKVVDEDFRDVEMCDDDYPLGTPNSTDCAEPQWHHLIYQENMCREAATEANVTVDENSFMVPTGFQKFRPKGCFLMNCEQDPNGICYYFNNYDLTPIDILGTPVCVRYKFRNGTLDSSGVNGVSCPSGYQHITKENNCSLAATCEGSCQGSPFVIPKEQRNFYPSGCFLHQDIGCYFFNPMMDENGTAWPTPTNATGYPLCNVSHHTHWPPTIDAGPR